MMMLELTESIVIENIDDTVQKMNALKEMGIRMSIDDFGTGYSSLAYLKRLPLDQLKINNDFVQDVTTDVNDAVIVETIISMARHLGLHVVAEGVENEEQMMFLMNNGCELYQGYYFSRPIPQDAFLSYLSQS
jgi:EAL domain-containing protein (putative c-di-GMP-specific phosphodiesterase class I)